MGNTSSSEEGFCPPIEIIMAVLDHCDWRERRALLSVNKHFFSLTLSSTFWRKMCEQLSQRHLVYIPARPIQRSWRVTFLHSFGAIRHTLPRDQLAPLPLSPRAEAALAEAAAATLAAAQLEAGSVSAGSAGSAVSAGSAGSAGAGVTGAAAAAASTGAAEDSMSDPDDGGEEGLRVNFTVKVFARLRDGTLAGEEPKREVATIPLSQRLVMLETQHKCTRREALRLLWARDGPAEDDPWADAFVEEQEENEEGDGEDGANKENASMALTKKKKSSSPRHVRQPIDAHARVGVLSVRERQIIMCAPTLGVKSFRFNRVFEASTSQTDVYDFSASGIVADVVNGINGCIFTYGQTGSGKTYTMFGPDDKASTSLTKVSPMGGIAPRALAEIFHAVEARAQSIGATVRMSYVEVFGDEIADLLRDGAPLDHWHGVAARMVSEGRMDFEVPSLADAEEHLRRAEGAKRRAATAMNQRSSRAHSVLLVSTLANMSVCVCVMCVCVCVCVCV
jgi:hypothetical protein